MEQEHDHGANELDFMAGTAERGQGSGAFFPIHGGII
jgi:hypothetical protein